MKLKQLNKDVTTYLQNIQNLRNSKTVPRRKDALMEITRCYQGEDSNFQEDLDDCNPQKVSDELAQWLLESWDNDACNDGPCEKIIPKSLPNKIDFTILKYKSGKQHAKNNLVTPEVGGNDNFHFVEAAIDSSNTEMQVENNAGYDFSIQSITKSKLVQLIVNSKKRKLNPSNSSNDRPNGESNLCGGIDPQENPKIKDSEIQANGSVSSIWKWSKNAKNMDQRQERAFQIMTATFVMEYYKEALQNSNLNMEKWGKSSQTEFTLNSLTPSDRVPFNRNWKHLRQMANSDDKAQLVMFLTGAGGSGKSEIITQVLKYAEQFCSNLNVPFDRYTIRVTALTGVAATSIFGETIHSAAHLKKSMENITREHINEWKSRTKLLIVDEISFMSISDLRRLDSRLVKLMGNEFGHLYGGCNIVFCGDFSQLEPVSKSDELLYCKTFESCRLWHNAINCFISLEGKWRFKDDPEWGNILTCLHDGNPTESDLHEINKRVVSPSTKLPSNLKYGTYQNCVRDTINTSLFEQVLSKHKNKEIICPGVIVVLCDDLKMKDSLGTYKPFAAEMKFWSSVGESDCKCGQGNGRMDPMLKLYNDIELRMTINADAARGQANGTRVNLQKVVLKSGQSPSILEVNGTKVNVVLAGQIDYILVKHKSTRNSTFKVAPISREFTAKYPLPIQYQATSKTKTRSEYLKVKALQLPLIVNNTTTGYKLQGVGLDSLFVSEWNNGARNWVYVMLSRVCTRNGLFLRTKIPTDPMLYAMSPELASMLAYLNSTVCCADFSLDDIPQCELVTSRNN